MMKKRVCFLSDSIGEHGHFLYALRSYIHNKKLNVSIYNCGLGGMSADRVTKEQIDCEVLTLNAEYCIISFGVNDLGIWLYDSYLKVTDEIIRQRNARAERYFNGIKNIVKATANKDRIDAYFNSSNILHPSGTLWQYDSPGSQILCALVERLSGMPFLEYLKAKLFNKMGTFQTASILKIPTGESFGDSGLLCTPRDTLSFARLLMDKGVYNGEQLINAEYVEKATSPIVADTLNAHEDGLYCGYGYQIWTMKNNCFGFIGMGQQLTFCYPEKDLIFVINSDNQGAQTNHSNLLDVFYDTVVKNTGDEPLDENDEEYEALSAYVNSLELRCLQGIENQELRQKINGKRFVAIDKNRQGIEYVRLSFKEDNTGVLYYKNGQGEKELAFGVNKNEFGVFPEYGYSSDIAGVPSTDDSLYKCATSLAFTSKNQLSIYVQVIDRYFGNLSILMGFKGDYVSVYMSKVAENFFNEYMGEFVAKLDE